ncbi:MAG: TIGR00159 family protein [Bacteroidia bacterium]|nr:TIGR00159 family protein [Bacteroidia bacterium]
MYLLFPVFRDFSVLDAIDILLVSILLYQLYQLVRGTMAINILIGILAIYLVWKTVELLEMKLLGEILGKFIGVGAIALIIVFQQELRRFLLFVGTSEILSRGSLRRNWFTFARKRSVNIDLSQLMRACRNMSESRTGALIVIAGSSDLNFFSDTGEQVDARLTSRMLESIFFKNNPLHDGAVIIKDNRIQAARCVLPVTEDQEFPAHLGMRHRAAVGITENSDAIAIVVSEQTGEMAVANGGKLSTGLSTEHLRETLEAELR